jgi:hypothetical protein
VTGISCSVTGGGAGDTVVNKIPPENKGGISVPLVGSFSATVFTDVSVTFFGQQQNLALDQSAQWAFTAPATTGTITYTYRIVPQAGLAAAVANQIVNTVAGSLPPLPAPTPYVVQTVVPAVPNLGGVNLPQLPTVNVPAPGGPITPPTEPGTPLPTPPGDPAPVGQPLPDTPGDQYAYSTGAGARMSPSDVVAASAFDPARYFVPGQSLGGADRAGPHSGGGAGGLPGNYDGASVPVFGQLAGLDGAPLEDGLRGLPVHRRAGPASGCPRGRRRAGHGHRRARADPSGVARQPLNPWPRPGSRPELARVGEAGVLQLWTAPAGDRARAGSLVLRVLPVT